MRMRIMTKPILSYPLKLDNVPSFDLPLSTCKNRCMYNNIEICYAMPKNNRHEYYPSRKNKLRRNLKLIRSNKFITKLTKAIIKSKSLYFRFFSSGQLENLDQLIKVLNVCRICKNVKFCLMCNNEIIYTQLIQSKIKIPSNVNLLLSNYIPNEKTPIFIKDYFIKFGIGVTQSTIKKSLTTCNASLKNGLKCNTCTDCYNKKDITFKIHGRFNKKRVLK